MGVQIFTDKQQFKNKPTTKYGQDVRLGKDGLTLEFLYLDDLQDDTPEDHKVVQYYEYSWVEGQTGEKRWNVSIPCGDDDPEELKDNERTRYQYAANILINRCYWTESGEECELNGDTVTIPWKDRPMEDRVKILAQGKDTSNEFLMYLEDWLSDNSGAPGHLMRLSRFRADNRTKYGLRFVKDQPLTDDARAEAEKYHHDLVAYLKDKREFGLRHWGNLHGKSAPEPVAAVNPKDTIVEGDESPTSDIFADVSPEDIAPTAREDFVG